MDIVIIAGIWNIYVLKGASDHRSLSLTSDTTNVRSRMELLFQVELGEISVIH